MDWFLDPPTATTASRLRKSITAYLSRHSTDVEVVRDAESIVGELLCNAVEHAGGPIWVSLEWGGSRPVLTVHDLGEAFECAPALPECWAERGRGLWMVSQLASDLAVAAKRTRGKSVSATLPVDRETEPSFDPVPRRLSPLPPTSEAGPQGFGREPFLRALVVELALAVEEDGGPHRAQEMIAQVGATVGSQMEQEYRQTHAIGSTLTPRHLAGCYVRLKAALGGDFRAVEIEDDRIVLVGVSCPFGAAVHLQPALCRMTSSVFGGIAARNAGNATVVLEERIAVGDPECRVTVLLGERASQASTGHRYGRAQVRGPSAAPAPAPDERNPPPGSGVPHTTTTTTPATR